MYCCGIGVNGCGFGVGGCGIRGRDSCSIVFCSWFIVGGYDSKVVNSSI
jgi:hypothetical protein